MMRRLIVFIALLVALPRVASAQPTEPIVDEAPPEVAPDAEQPAPVDLAPVAEEPVAEAEEEADAVVEIEPTLEPEAPSALSTLLENVAIHGFGNYGAGWTRVREHNSNDFLYGDRNGEFGFVNFSMRELVQPIPELRFSAGQSFSFEDGQLK